jgi:rRNA maturation RNase YbeY
MAITYITENVTLPKRFKRRLTSQWIKDVIRKHEKKAGDIAYIFCNDGKIIEMNRQYLQHDYFTDIITFDYTDGNTISGDVFISLETVKTNAEQYKTTYEEELRRVVIHGVLHLCGYKDKTRKDRENMREKEDEALGLYAGRLNNEI